MSKGKGAKAPSTPDYAALAQQQGQINQQTASQLTSANRPNQYDAFGNSITWTKTPTLTEDAQAAQRSIDGINNYIAAHPGAAKYYASGIGAQELNGYKQRLQSGSSEDWAQHQNLSPEFQAMWDKYNKDTGAATSRYGDILNQYLQGYTPSQFSSSAQNLKAYNDPEFNGDSVANALYDSVMSRAAPQQKRDKDYLDTQLRQQGLIPGTEAYNRSMQNLLTSQGDVVTKASQDATLAGASEGRAKYAAYLGGQGQQYGQDQNTYQINRNQPLQELSGMAGLAGGTPYTPTYTGFSSATGYNPTDLLGAAQATQAANQSKANASNSKKGGLLSAGTSLGGAYLGGK